MLDLRNEAIALVSTIPEKYLPSVVGLMQSLKYVSDSDPQTQMPKKKIDFTSTEEIDEYIRESRREREF